MVKRVRVNAFAVTSRELEMKAVFLRAVPVPPSEAAPANRQKSGNQCVECASPGDSVELSDEAKRKSCAASATGSSPELSAQQCLDSKDMNFDRVLSAKELGVPNVTMTMLDQNADGKVDEGELRSRDARAPHR